jgi:feruloyl esterase
MRTKRNGKADTKLFVRGVSLGAVIVGTFAAAPAWAALPNCSVAALNALKIPNMTFTTATDVAAAGTNPEYCDAFGSVNIDGQTAGFQVQLPSGWNSKMVFYGIGGTGGEDTSPSANAVDIAEALGLGYATAITDLGHETPTTSDDSFAILSAGVPNIPAIVDYNYRATHEVTVATKTLLERYYRKGMVRRAYYDGCSGGGRAALSAAGHYPKDFDGIISGDAGIGQKYVMTLKSTKAEFDPPTARLPVTLLPAIDAASYAACDALDGVKDGLIQNPAICTFNPQTMLCTGGNTTGCLTQDQINGLKNYVHPMTDENGRVSYPGYFLTDLSSGSFNTYALSPTPVTDPTACEPWGTGTPGHGWALGDTQLKYFYARDPNYCSNSFPMSVAGVTQTAALNLYNERIRAFNSTDDDPDKIQPFLNDGRKLIIYNGYSDPSTSPGEIIRYYEELAALRGGYDRVQREARLFMVPGMQHCSGGPGPNSFDTLVALDNWVEKGTQPNGIIATKYVNDTKSDGVSRTMPLCEFPQEARYYGTGDVNDAASWACPERDTRLLQIGPAGVAAGLTNVPPSRDETFDSNFKHDWDVWSKLGFWGRLIPW